MTQNRRRRPASQTKPGTPPGEAKNGQPAAVAAVPEAAPPAPLPNMILIDQEMLDGLNAVVVRPAQVNIGIFLIRTILMKTGGNLGVAITAARDIMRTLDLEPQKANAIAMRALSVTNTFGREEFARMWPVSGTEFVPTDQLLIAAARGPLELPTKPGDAAVVSPAVLHALALSAMELPGPPGAVPVHAPPPSPPAEPAKPEGEA